MLQIRPELQMDIREYIAGITSILLIIGVFFLRKTIVTDRDFSMRVFGGLLIFIISLLNDSVITSCLAILFIATFITDRRFIENIAALAFGRKEFWQYRQATPEELAVKTVEESIKLADHAETVNKNNGADAMSLDKQRKASLVAVATESLEFEKMVIDALKAEFPGFDIAVERVVVSTSGQKYFIDALMTSNIMDIIVEIKTPHSVPTLRRAIADSSAQLKKYKDAYYSTLGGSKWIETVIVVPEIGEVYVDAIPIGGSVVLVFDRNKRVFLNGESLHNRLIEGSRL